MIFEFYEQKCVEEVYLKLNMVQSTKQVMELIRHVSKGGTFGECAPPPWAWCPTKKSMEIKKLEGTDSAKIAKIVYMIFFFFFFFFFFC